MTSLISQLSITVVAISIIGLMKVLFLSSRKKSKSIRRVSNIRGRRKRTKEKEFINLFNAFKDSDSSSEMVPRETKIVPVGFFEIFTSKGIERCNLELNEEYTFRIGSSPDYCDLILDSPYVSAIHAEIVFDEEENSYVLQDLDSLNGTYVENEQNRITAVYIEDGMRVNLGKAVSMIYHHGYDMPTYEREVKDYESRKEEKTIVVDKM